MPGWSARHGKWTRVDNQTVQGHSSKNGLLLELDRKLSAPFEVRMEIEFVKQRYPKHNSGGIIWHDSNRTPRWKPSWFHGLLLFQDGNNLSRFTPSKKNKPLVDVAVKDSNKFRMKVAEGQVTCYVNGSEVWQGDWFEQDDVYLPNPKLGLGGHYWYGGDTLRFANVEIRSPKE